MGAISSVTFVPLATAVPAAGRVAQTCGGASSRSSQLPVSSSEVERLAKSFASAYGDEDAARISRLLTADVQRTSPDDSQTGRRAVVAAYESQFARNAIKDFKLGDVAAEGGPSGRATAHYTVTYDRAKPTPGQMTWIVINDKGRPRISLIAFRPD